MRLFTAEIAFVKGQRDGSGHEFLRLGEEGIEGFTQGREPMPVIDKLRVGDAQDVAVISRLPVQTQGFQFPVSRQNQRSSGCFIDAARFHADHAILHHVHAADAVGSPDFVQVFEQLNGWNPMAIQTDGHALLEIDRDLAVSVRAGTGIQRKFEAIFRRRLRGIFEDAAFVADVPDVGIATVYPLCSCGDGDVSRLARRRSPQSAMRYVHSRQGAMILISGANAL